MIWKYQVEKELMFWIYIKLRKQEIVDGFRTNQVEVELTKISLIYFYNTT